MQPYQKLPLSTVISESVPKPFELSEKSIERLKNFSDILLTTLTIATTLTMIVVAPNALQAFDIFYKRKRGGRKLRHKEKVQKVTRTFYYLKESGWLDFKRKGNDYEIVITKQGKRKIRSLNFETLSVAKPSSWDGKFWQVAADIPTKDNKKYADAFRRKLKEMGFYLLQRTLWFYPYNPRVEVEFVSRHYGIFNFVTVMKIEELDPSDYKLLKQFFKSKKVI